MPSYSAKTFAAKIIFPIVAVLPIVIVVIGKLLSRRRRARAVRRLAQAERAVQRGRPLVWEVYTSAGVCGGGEVDWAHIKVRIRPARSPGRPNPH